MNEVSVTPPKRFRPLRVLAIAVPAIFVVLGGFGYLTFLGGIEQLQAWTRPPLVKVTGRVMWNGKPVPNAQIATVPEREDLHGALGMADEQGRFELKTDVDGHLLEGAYAGKHRVQVAGYRVHRSGIRQLLTPRIYTDIEESPLVITVSSDESPNEVDLVLKGEAGGSTPAAPTAFPRGPSGPSTGEQSTREDTSDSPAADVPAEQADEDASESDGETESP